MKSFTTTMVLFMVSFGFLFADEKKDDLEAQRIISDLFQYHLEKAEASKQVFVFVESPEGALFVIYKKDFKNILIHSKKRQVRVSLVNADYQVFEKPKCRVKEFKYPKRFRSVLFARNSLRVRKDNYQGNYTHKITTSAQFIEQFYIKAKRSFQSAKGVAISAKIYDFRPKTTE